MALSSRLGATEEPHWGLAPGPASRVDAQQKSENRRSSRVTIGPGRTKEMLDHWAGPRHVTVEESSGFVSGNVATGKNWSKENKADGAAARKPEKTRKMVFHCV